MSEQDLNIFVLQITHMALDMATQYRDLLDNQLTAGTDITLSALEAAEIVGTFKLLDTIVRNLTEENQQIREAVNTLLDKIEK